jgi:hypothetical protein
MCYGYAENKGEAESFECRKLLSEHPFSMLVLTATPQAARTHECAIAMLKAKARQKV